MLAKKNLQISSLLLSIAVLLGLVAGCSDCDRPRSEGTAETTVNVCVGLSDNDTLTKKYNVPDSASYLECYLVENNEAIYDTVFGPEDNEYDLPAYQTSADGSVLMSNTIKAEDASRIDNVMVEAYNQAGEFLGLLNAEGITVQENQTNLVDFTKDDAPDFQSAEELAKRTTLVVTTTPAAQEGVTTIAVGEIATVTVMTTTPVGEATTRDVYLYPDEYTMTADSEAVSTEENAVIGVAATTSPAEVNVTAHTPTTITTSFKVEVVEE